MERRRYFTSPVHRQGARQRSIDAHHPGTPVPYGLSVEMYYLIAAVYSGVGAPGANQVHRFVGDLTDTPGQFRLYGWQAAFLRLPAMIGGTIIFKHKRDSALTDGIITGKGD